MRKRLAAALMVLIGAEVALVTPGSAKTTDAPTISLYHLQGVAEDAARGDILYCLRMASPALSKRSAIAGSNQYGLVGSLLNGWLGAGATDRMRSAILDRCMLAHGYRIYRTDEASWIRLLGVSQAIEIRANVADAVIVDAMAVFASRPLPAGENLGS